MKIQIKRVYDRPARGDGLRVLVDRLWPRGVKKSDARIDLWAKDLGPSTALRKWFGHEAAKFAAFRDRYQRELGQQDDAVRDLLAKADGRTITLLYAARDLDCNHAVVLRDFLSS